MVACTTCHPAFPRVSYILGCAHDDKHWGSFYVDLPGRPWFNEPNCFYTYGLIHFAFDRRLGYTR